MPAFGWKPSDEEIADPVTYSRNSWGNNATSVANRKVADVRKSAERSAQQ